MTGSPLLFMHIPKTGGSTVTSVLMDQYDASRVRRVYEEGMEALLAMPQGERDSLACVMGHFPYGLHRHFTRPCRYVTMLRDPVDLAISLYFFIRNHPAHPWHSTLRGQGVTLREYVEHDRFDHVDNYQVRFLTGRLHGGPLGRVDLEFAKGLLAEELAAFGLVERFDESMLLFRRVLGWRMPYYTRRNVFRRRADLETITQHDRVLIAERHALDRELLAFAADLFTRRMATMGSGFARELARFRRGNLRRQLGRRMGGILLSVGRLAARFLRAVGRAMALAKMGRALLA